MKFSVLKSLLKSDKSRFSSATKTTDITREALVKQGGDQFKQLLKRGLNIPVALL